LVYNCIASIIATTYAKDFSDAEKLTNRFNEFGVKPHIYGCKNCRYYKIQVFTKDVRKLAEMVSRMEGGSVQVVTRTGYLSRGKPTPPHKN
jgi:hypothetical protein